MTKTRILQTVCTLASLMMLAASCSDEMDTGSRLPEGKYPITFSAAVDGLTATRATTDNTWTGSEEIAIKIGSEVKKYKAASGGNLTIADGGTPFYWQNTGSINITAWYPYSDSYPEQWTVKANQNTSDNYQKSDLIKGELTLAFTDKDKPEKNKITFQHQTAKVIVNLTAEEGVVFDGNTSVQLLNVEGVEDGGTTVTLYRPNKEKQTYLALVNRQEIRANENFIHVTAGGNHYYYKPKEAKTLSGGTAYTYDITVKNTGLKVTVGSSMTWDNKGNTGNGSVAEVPDINLSSLTEDYTISDDGEYLVVGSGTHGLIINGSPRVRLSGVTITTTDKPAIKITSGSPTLIVKGENHFNTTSRHNSILLDNENASITIDGENSGTLEIAHTASDVALGAIIGGGQDKSAGSITIQNITLNFIGNDMYRNGAVIGSAFTYGDNASCGDIVITNTTLTVESYSVSGAIIGTGLAQAGTTTCEAITITLKQGQTKQEFLNKLNGSMLDGANKVGKGGVWSNGVSTCGTITWYESNGHIIQ